MIILKQNMAVTKEAKPILNLLPNQRAHGPSVQRVATGIEPKDVCGVDGCQSMFHHQCQTEWEIHQYHLDSPNGDP